MENCTFLDKAKLNYIILTDFMMDKAKGFTMLDFAIFKTYLFSIGLIFGACFSKKIKKALPLVSFISACSLAYLMYSMFFKKDVE